MGFINNFTKPFYFKATVQNVFGIAISQNACYKTHPCGLFLAKLFQQSIVDRPNAFETSRVFQCKQVIKLFKFLREPKMPWKCLGNSFFFVYFVSLYENSVFRFGIYMLFCSSKMLSTYTSYSPEGVKTVRINVPIIFRISIKSHVLIVFKII